MKRMKAVFENEEAVRLLNYFVSYKEIISKTENEKDSFIAIGTLAKPEEIVIK